MIVAAPDERPTFLGLDLRTLHADTASAAVVAQPDWTTGVDGNRISVASAGDAADTDGLSVVRAVAAAVWATGIARPELVAVDDTARAALRRWSLLDATNPLA